METQWLNIVKPLKPLTASITDALKDALPSRDTIWRFFRQLRWTSGEVRNAVSKWIEINIRLSDKSITTVRKCTQAVANIVEAIPGKRYMLYVA